VAIFLIELVGKLVNNYVAAIVGVCRALQHVLPREDHLPLRPRLSRQHSLPCVVHACRIGLAAFHHKRRRVQKYLPHVREIVRRHTAGPVQEQQTGMRSNYHAHLIGHTQAVAPDEGFFCQKHLHVLFELQLQIHRQAGKQRHALAQVFAPGCGKRLPLPLRTPPAQPARIRHQGKQQHQRCQAK